MVVHLNVGVDLVLKKRPSVHGCHLLRACGNTCGHMLGVNVCNWRHCQCDMKSHVWNLDHFDMNTPSMRPQTH